MTLQVFNSMSQEKEVFIPLTPGRVTMYTCGPTVYDHPHIGNWRCFVVFDTVRRYLEYLGYEVKFVQNFTDIDDKVIKKAEELGITTEALAEKYIDVYLREAQTLGIRKADVHPRATEHIPEMVDLVKSLLEKGIAYQVDKDVYFDITEFTSYGALSGQELGALEAGARVEVDQNKRNPLDFVLWKGEKPGEPSWPSPWGFGRPGWHLECSVMSMKHLGVTVDIHAGGIDLKFPHHENERAQSEAATGEPFVRYWLHNGFLSIGGERMGKSLGNISTLEALAKIHRPEAIRFFLLSAHYRSPLAFSPELLQSAESSLDRLYNAVSALEAAPLQEGQRDPFMESAVSRARNDFRNSMDDDFNTADALASLFDLTRDVNAAISRGPLHPDDQAAALEVYRELGGVLGLLGAASDTSSLDDISQGLLETLVEVRGRLRDQKEWALADLIRDRLLEMGIHLEDTGTGTRWKRR
jgi:cysteinyl-tRNA synthetase